ncbi:Uncharacterised protein [Mycobacteroides abscessus subsp. abscessus]|nr:Uncharacterised protein [Mycobacteroides abscessus subsp. abscessus]
MSGVCWVRRTLSELTEKRAALCGRRVSCTSMTTGAPSV